MLETDRLGDYFDWIDLGFVEREATPKPAMKLGIRLHVAGLSLSDTVSILDAFGVDRHRTTVQKWVQKADQQPADGRSPNQIALDETVIWINDEQFWLFAAVNPETNHLLHVRLFPTRTTVTTRMFLDELREKHLVDDASHRSGPVAPRRPPPVRPPISTRYARESERYRTCFSRSKTPNKAILQLLQPRRAEHR